MRKIYLVYVRVGGEMAEVRRAYTSKKKAKKWATSLLKPEMREYKIRSVWVEEMPIITV